MLCGVILGFVAVAGHYPIILTVRVRVRVRVMAYTRHEGEDDVVKHCSNVSTLTGIGRLQGLVTLALGLC